MSVQKNYSQKFKCVQLAANTPLSLSGLNSCQGLMLYFPVATANVVITERSTTTPANDGSVAIDRLVFNPSQIEAGQVTPDEANKRFTSTAGTLVGYYASSYHDQIEASAACTVMLWGDDDWKEFA